MTKLNTVWEYIKANIFEIAVFLLFCAITILTSRFHECWFDELQSWLIAKSNFHDILFSIPHNEGHPPLWHLILKFFQIFTLNPELVLKIPNLLIMFGAMYLLIFKSPFPKILRCTLPFSYYFVYQYSIVARPYSLLIMGLFLSAALYNERNNHPIKYIISLGLLASSSIYGMILATFISLLWATDILKTEKLSLKTFITKDKRFFVLTCLFLFCLFISILIFPDKDAYYVSRFIRLPVWQRIIYYIFGLPADATAFNVLNYGTGWIKNILNLYNIIAFIFGFYLLKNIIQMFVQNNYLKTFCFIYIPIAVFMGVFYCHPHHVGLIWVIFVYLFWVLINDKGIGNINLSKNFKYLLIFIMVMQLWWSIAAINNDIKFDYSPTHQLVKYIKENNLTDYNIITNNNTRYPNLQWISASLIPYFGKNIFYNYNIDTPDKFYVINKKISKDESLDLYKKWIQTAIPDVVITDNKIKKCWCYRYVTLSHVKNITARFIFKDDYILQDYNIFVREELLPKITNTNYERKNESK